MLQLEKINSHLKKDVDTEKVKIKQLAEEVCYVKFKRDVQKLTFLIQHRCMSMICFDIQMASYKSA